MGTAVYDSVVIISLLLLGMAFCKLAAFTGLSSRHHGRHKRRHPKDFGKRLTSVSILIPCYNEEPTLANCVESLMRQNYPFREIIIINDGSTDGTHKIAEQLSKNRPYIHALNKKNGGKASALNYGIERAEGDIVICIDADSMFMPNTVRELVLSFEDPDVVAVGGNVRVVNRKSILGREQALEYITGLTLQRRAFAHLGCMQVISGAIGAFRRDRLEEIGGYSKDTIVEDMDVTIELAKRGYKVVYNPNAVAYTEAPESVRDFMKQRYRWTFGSFQVLAKHKDIFFRRHYNRMGTIGMPYFAIFPWVDVLVSVMTISAALRVIITGDGFRLLIFFLAMSSLQAIIVMYALVIDKESKRLVVWAPADNLFYNHVIAFTTLKAGINYLRRKKTTWGKLRRYGKNTVPIVSSTGQ